jgi:Holliday junction resolvasome RuvABC endonuclease subunit
MILGLDVSTSVTGYCVLDKNGTLIKIGWIPLAKEKELVNKGFIFRDHVTDLIKQYPAIDKVYIEEAFQRYGRGMSSARTITRLAAFNGIVQYICAQVFKHVPGLISVSESRKLCGIKTQSKKKAGKEVKEQVFEWVDNHLSYKWPKKVLKSGPRRGQTIIAPESRDMADAWVVAQAGFVKSRI